MDKIIILDDMAYIRYRVKDILESTGIEVYESANSFDFFNKLYDKKDDISLIILEVGLSSEDGFEVLRKVKARDLKIPIMILTKLNTRTEFIKCIKEGTSEYILKPFTNKLLVERAEKLIKSYKAYDEPGEIIYLNFQEYIVKQIEKAKIEKKNLSVMMVSLIKSSITNQEEKIEVRDSYIILMDLLYERLKELFKTPDLFEKYGLSTFVGVLPGCNNKNTYEIMNKMQRLYNEIKKEDPMYMEYNLECVFATFPEDGLEKQQLLDKLAAKMKHKIDSK